MKTCVTLVTLAVLVSTSCASNPQPGEPGYSFNLNGQYTLQMTASDGSSFAGNFQLKTLRGGAITGTMSITTPMNISGQVEGSLLGSEVRLQTQYEVTGMGCGGLVEGTAVVSENGIGADGLMEVIEDECGSGFSTMTFSLIKNS